MVSVLATIGAVLIALGLADVVRSIFSLQKSEAVVRQRNIVISVFLIAIGAVLVVIALNS